MSVRPIPEGFHTVTTFLLVKDVPAQIDFLERAFGDRVNDLTKLPDGTVLHAQVSVGDSIVMMGTAKENSPGMPCLVHLYVEDKDAWYHSAIAAGATSLQEPRNEFYGDRTAGVQDSQGNL